MKAIIVRTGLAVFLGAVVVAAWPIEKPILYLDADPAPFALDAEGPRASFRTSVSFDPRAELRDLVVQLEPQAGDDGGSRVEVYVNGRCASHVRLGGVRWTSRVPRLFLKAGANELEIRNPTGKPLKLLPLAYPSHRVVVSKAPEGEALPPLPEIWGEPEYRWEKGEVALWVAVQGEGKALLEDASVEAVRGAKKMPMTRVGAGNGGWARDLPVRHEAVWPLEELASGPNPVKVVVRAKGYRDAETWFPLRKPFLPGPVRRVPPSDAGTFVPVSFRVAPDQPLRDFRFRVFVPENSQVSGALEVDYDGLMGWVSHHRSRGGTVYLDRAGQGLRDRFGDFVYLTETDGLIVKDGAGWDAAVETGGFWDKLLNQGQRTGILGDPCLVETSGEDRAGMLEAIRRGAAVVSDAGWDLEIELAGARPLGTASLPFGDRAELRIRASCAGTRVASIDLISNLQRAASWAGQEKVTHSIEACSPGYFRVMARAEDGRRAITAPIWLEVRPSARDQVVKAWGEARLYDPAAEPLPRELAFDPPDDGFYVLELGVDPGAKFAGGDERLEISLDGKGIATYRAASTIHGGDGKTAYRHIVPFRASLGRLTKGRKATIACASPAPDDGIGVAYAYVLRTGLPALALVDLHSHSKITENFSNELHRTMGYNLISTAHGGFRSPDTRKEALAKARSLSDRDLRVLIGGERGDHFGAVHMSLGFITQELEAWNARDASYSSALALGLDWGGVGCLNHPVEDGRLGWRRGNFQWGTTDPHYHGFAGWSHKEHHYGAGDHYWRLVTLFEFFNGYGAPNIANGKNEGGHAPRSRWHEETGRYVRGERRAPLFAVGNTDTKTFQQETERLRIGSMYAGTFVHAASLEPSAIGAAMMAGNSVAACHADTRLLAVAEDGQGRLYHPGNRILAAGPITVWVEAWSPHGISVVRVVGPRGTWVEKSVKGARVSESLRLEALGPWDWFRVEVRGDATRTGAVSNPFLR